MGKEVITVMPTFWLSDEEMEHPRTHVLYGAFAIAVWKDLVKISPSLPEHILIIGDNWSMITKKGGRIDEDGRLYLDEASEIVPRRTRFDTDYTDTNLATLLKYVTEVWHIDEITVLDRTSVAYRDSVFELAEGEVTQDREEPAWGRVFRLKDPDIEVYLITHGYTEKPPLELFDGLFE